MLNIMKTTAAAMLALALALHVAAGQARAEQQFTDAERDALHGIIKDYLLENPQLLNEMAMKLQQAEREQQQERAREAIAGHKDALFRSSTDVSVGNPDGSVTVVEFFDYNCGFCRGSVPHLLRLLEADKNVRIVMKEFPILSEGSLIAARAAIASRNQNKYWEFHLALMAAQGNIDDEAKVMEIAEQAGVDVEKLKSDMQSQSAEIDSIIAGNQQLAQALGINGTPAFVIDDELLPGAAPFEQLASSVNAVRETGGCKFC